MFPGAGRRIFSETTTAPGVRRGIGSALVLLPLLACCGLLPPAPALTRRTRWAAGILMASLASLALLPPEPAQAQTTVDLVTNTSLAPGSNVHVRSINGQSFATGPNSTGYTVTQVRVVFQDASRNDSTETTVKIRNNSASNRPGTLVATLTQSGTAALRGTMTFTAPANTTLSASTTYWLTVNEDKNQADRAFLTVTIGNSETGVTGWSIGNRRRFSAVGGGTPNWSTSSNPGSSALIAIRGYANTAPTIRLSATSITRNSATLTLANNSATWYYKRTAPTAGSCSSAQTGSTTRLRLTALSENTSYTYRAYSNSACTTQIASVTFRTGDLAPPANLRAEAGNGQVTLSWDTVTGARGYRYRVWEGTGENERAVTNWVWFSGSHRDTSSGVVTGLTNGTTYTFRVHAMKRGLVTYVYPGGNVVRREQWLSGRESAPVTATPVGASPGACGGRLTGDGSVTGRWVTGGPSSTARGQRYACWYEFSLSERRRVSISLRSGDADPYLYLRSGTRRSGTSIVSNDDGGPGQNSRIIQALDPGTYTIEATTFGQAETGGFTLTLSSETEREASPSASRCTQQLTGDGAVTGRWAAGCDSIARAGRHARWYEFTLAGRRDVVINLQSGGADSYLYLRSGAGERLGRAMASDDDGGQGYNSRIARTLDAGTYTIEATTYGSGETGGFTLTLGGTGETATRPPEETEPVDEPTTSEPPPASEPELRIFDARANEGSPYNSGEMHFRVTLAPAQSGSVGVCWRTQDGTARGDYYGRYGDYDAGSGCMYFAAGETTKYISVRLIGDWHDEGDETFFMVLEDARGAIIADGEATGTIVNSGPIPKGWTTRFARTVADQVLDAVEGRMGSDATPGMEVNLAGQGLGWPSDSGESGNGAAGGLEALTVNGGDLLSSSSFALASPVSDGGLLSFWGRGSVTSFDGREGELSLDGQVSTVMLGTDWRWGPVAGRRGGQTLHRRAAALPQQG